MANQELLISGCKKMLHSVENFYDAKLNSGECDAVTDALKENKFMIKELRKERNFFAYILLWLVVWAILDSAPKAWHFIKTKVHLSVEDK